MTDPNKTSITIILDSSGSMSSCTNDTIGGLNTFLEDQQKLTGTCDISLIQFSTETKITYKSTDVKLAPKLSYENYKPSGNTALYDAICIAIDEKGKELSELPEDQRPGKVIMVIITDGEENSSKLFNIHDVKNKITHQKDKYNWVFTFLGANQDAFLTADSIGISKGATLNFSSTSKGGAKRAFAAVSNYSNVVRCCDSYDLLNSVQYTDADRLNNAEPIKP